MLGMIGIGDVSMPALFSGQEWNEHKTIYTGTGMEHRRTERIQTVSSSEMH